MSQVARRQKVIPGTAPTRPLPADFWERAKIEALTLWAAHEQERRWGEEAERYRASPAGQATAAKFAAWWAEYAPRRQQEQAERERVAKATAPAYAVLGLQFGAPPTEVKKAYRKKARQAHPDAGGSHAQMLLIMPLTRSSRPPRNSTTGQRPCRAGHFYGFIFR